jgi:hypothetical protein
MGTMENSGGNELFKEKKCCGAKKKTAAKGE